jgi:DNA polymerase-3 subunit beta
LTSTKIEFSPPDQATLLATDLELGIRYKVSGVQVDREGSVLLPLGQVLAILRELSDESIQISTASSGILIRGETSRFELSTDDPAQFPDVPRAEDENGVSVKSGLLGTMIRRTTLACAAENSRYALHSVLVEFDDDKARFVATDSKRLALMPGLVEVHGPAPEGTWLLPPKALQLLARVLQDPEESVMISLNENDASFRTAKMTIYTRLVEGRFPKYHDVFPAEVKHRIPLPVGRFHSVVRQARIVTNEDSKGVDFRFSEGTLTVTSRSAGLGESEVRLPVGHQGEDVEVTYDPQLIIDALKVLDPEEEVTLEIGDVRRASVFRTRDEYAYVLMPLTKDV